MMWPPCPINYAWWAESNDTSLNFLALREPSETPLPVGHQKCFEKIGKIGHYGKSGHFGKIGHFDKSGHW